MAADLILTLTNLGDALELDSLIEGAAIPKLSKLVIGTGDAVTEEAEIKALTEVPNAWATKLNIGQIQRLPNGGGAKLFAHMLLDMNLPTGKKITGIGVELLDGTLYGYTPYYPQSGGVEKPVGMALTLYVILAKLNAKVLTVQYEPYDSDAMADIVLEKIASNSSVRTILGGDVTLQSGKDHYLVLSENVRLTFPDDGKFSVTWVSGDFAIDINTKGKLLNGINVNKWDYKTANRVNFWFDDDLNQYLCGN